MTRTVRSAPLCLSICLVSVSVSVCVSAAAAQQTTATITVAYEIREINEISFSGDPEPLVVSRAVAGGAPQVAIDDRTTWTLATNGSDKRVTAVLDAAMPAGVSLAVRLAAPGGASSAGEVALSTTEQTLVSRLSSVSAQDLGVTYTLAATVEAGVVERNRRRITFTIVADP